MTSLNQLRENERESDFGNALKSELTGKIRAYRIVKGVSIEDLSEKANVSIEQIRSVEDGEEDADFSTLYRLSKALNLKINLEIKDLDK